MSDPTLTPAWQTLTLAGASIAPIRELIDQNRSEFRSNLGEIEVDFTRQRIDASVWNTLKELVVERKVADRRDQMCAGVHVNQTEDRAVLHSALRLPRDSQLVVDGVDIVEAVHSVLERMSVLAERVRNGDWRGFTGKRIESVVNIGIGGSDLGPAMAHQALRAFTQPNIAFFFVSNVDPADLVETLKRCNPETTLFIIASKTFTTAETMSNAQQARDWVHKAVTSQDLEPVVSRHFVALSTNEREVSNFGIDAANMFEFWDWVGGRYSMESAIGLSTMIAIGPRQFGELLNGFRQADVNFQNEPWETNIAMQMGALAVWNRDFLGINTTAVLPYAQYLERFPAYLQQLTMESNGKNVRSDGESVSYDTGAIYWGEAGTNGQHSFYQLLHQGTNTVSCDIIVVARARHDLGDQQDMLVANALAQASVLSLGMDASEVADSGVPAELVPHKVMPGNRPVTVIMCPELNPFVLGMLVALYENCVFVQGAIWGINSFDQWGVELGKQVAMGISEAFELPSLAANFDQSTAASINRYLNLRDQG
ncbi:MAG: glucose-6-phosphate isomerase [Candidatus Nanopelagicales bacterium]|nr:glucose-6-phosphate isomerase [Candidatus Nanopelagicales bacterium]